MYMAAWRYKISLRSEWVKSFFYMRREIRIFMQLCNILYVLFCRLVWKHLGILTSFKLISPERIKNMDTKNVNFSEIHVYYLSVGHSVSIYIWGWCRQPLFFFTVQELCSEHVTLLKKAYKFYMFVSVLSSPKYFILPCVS